MHGICDFRVNLHRLTAKKIVALTTGKKKLSAKTNVNSVRFHVSWLPTASNTNPSAINAKKVAGKRGSRIQSLHEQSTNDITCNAAMDGEYLHDVSTSAPHKGKYILTKTDLFQLMSKPDIENIPAKSLPAKCKRTLSVLEERPKPTNEDLHSELLKKLNTPNRSLLPAGRRSVPDPIPVPLPEWKIFFKEFQEKAVERKKQQNIQK